MSTNYEYLAIQLQNYIKNYTPTGWKESLGRCMFTPSISSLDVVNLLKERSKGIVYFRNYLLDHLLRQPYEPQYICDAIIEFFDKKC